MVIANSMVIICRQIQLAQSLPTKEASSTEL